MTAIKEYRKGVCIKRCIGMKFLVVSNDNHAMEYTIDCQEKTKTLLDLIRADFGVIYFEGTADLSENEPLSKYFGNNDSGLVTLKMVIKEEKESNNDDSPNISNNNNITAAENSPDESDDYDYDDDESSIADGSLDIFSEDWKKINENIENLTHLGDTLVKNSIANVILLCFVIILMFSRL